MASNRNRVVAAVSAAALVGGGVGAGAVALTHDSSSSQQTAAPAPTVSNISSSGTLTVAQIAKQSAPGVVEIDTVSTSQNQSPFPGSGGSQSAAEGTGFVYDTKGDIITNEHVIDGANSIRVKFSDGSTYQATLVGRDTSSDLAVIHVDAPASKLTPLALGDSSSLVVGDGVVAIGNPFGLDNTVTTGIVSALDREIAAPDNTPIEGAIQTDAAINHGNSGGPLLALDGKVIGVNSQIQSDSGGNDGVGFAIPSNFVKSIVTQLLAGGKVQHALLGVTVKTATNGVGVGTVESGSGAANGGVKAGDVIRKIDGTTVTSATQLRAVIAAHKPGDKVTLTVIRGGETTTVDVTLGARSTS